jgi:cytochrome c oxidase subunit II
MRPSVAASALAVALAAVLLLTAAPAAARFGMPEPLTDRGKTIDGIYTKITLVGIIVFVLVFALLVWILARYREGSGHGRATHERHRGSIKAELVWTIIPLAIMLWIGVMSYAGLVKLDAGLGGEGAEMEVKITGFQWFWQMEYGDGVKVVVIPTAAANGSMTYSDTFHLPADTPILLNLTGNEVIHAFNILDANRAYVAMDDANPSGPHKYHLQVMSLPSGDYHIQCKEMCLNPGHGYMRANLVVEPKAQFEEWKADRALLGSAALTSFVDVTAKDGKLTYATAPPSVVVAGTRVGVKLHNAGSQPVTFGVDGQGSTATVAPGDIGRLAFDANGTTTYTVGFVPGGSFNVTSVVPDAEISVSLKDFAIDPPQIRMEVGKGYLIRASNIGAIGHNLFLGHFGGDIVAASNTASTGQDALVYYKPTTAGTIEMWCNVPGHHGLGMTGTVVIS